VGHNNPRARIVNRIVIRGALLTSLILSIVIRFQSGQAHEVTVFDASAAAAKILENHGFQLLENPIKPPKVLSVVVYFQRPECDRASLVLPYFINAEAEPLLARVTVPGSERQFYFLSGAWEDQRRVPMFLEWAKYAILDLFHASPYVTVKQAIALVDPPDCRPVEIIDWRALWAKDRSQGSGSAKETEAARG
jgi:hypothetical protein